VKTLFCFVHHTCITLLYKPDSFCLQGIKVNHNQEQPKILENKGIAKD